MKEETIRIMKMVQEGKISAEDAAELLEAFNDSPDTESRTGETPKGDAPEGEAEEPKASAKEHSDVFGTFFGAIDQLTKDVSKNVNWSDIADKVRKGVDKGVDAIKQVADDATKGRGGWANLFGEQADRVVELPLKVPAGKVLKIESANGNVKIEGGEPVGSVRVAARFKGYSEAEAKQLADQYMPVLEEGYDFIALRHNVSDRMSADVIAKVAEGTVVEIKATSGDVEVKGTKAGARVTSTSGDVKLDGVGGSVEVSAQSGEVELSNSSCSVVTVESKSGSVALTGVTGLLSVRSASGDVNLRECSGRTVSVEASTGDINVDLVAPVEGAANLRSVRGDVNLEISDGSDCRVHLSTLKGAVAVHGLDLKDENRDKLVVTGRLGEGTGTIDMSAVSGDVNLRLRDSSV
ncbi:MAG: DUF4097 family beta strand repeat protein [Fimbriimonadaceae bacterium]|nr:DUF4097 family beta strand repeat protein [Fimbriimonadaceae bacterium]